MIDIHHEYIKSMFESCRPEYLQSVDSDGTTKGDVLLAVPGDKDVPPLSGFSERYFYIGSFPTASIPVSLAPSMLTVKFTSLKSPTLQHYRLTRALQCDVNA
jgi:hypothetical protein